MNDVLLFLNFFGIKVDNSTPFEILVAGYFLIFSVLILINVINIIIYLLTIYIITNEKLLSKIPAKYTYIHKLLKYYKNIRIYFIIVEFIFILIFLIMMISVSYGLVSVYIQYN